jgi:energy-coupling factor transporter transmembrane protein EcfT
MLLIEIDKNRYRRHLNIVMSACIAFLVLGSLGIAQLLILLFPATEGTHFHWNLLGVIATVLIILAVVNHYKKHPLMFEVLYVWKLKQALNLIARKLTKIESAARMGDKTALLALQFSYSGSRQLWLLDDNTLTLSKLVKSEAELQQLLLKYDISLDITKYHSELLKSF